MPPLERTDRREKALLWAANGVNTHGQVTVASTPSEIVVRWATKRRTVVDAKGNAIGVDATVVVNQEIEIGSIIWLGSLDDAAGSTPTSDLMEVRTYDETPDIKNRHRRREVTVARYNDTLPTS